MFALSWQQARVRFANIKNPKSVSDKQPKLCPPKFPLVFNIMDDSTSPEWTNSQVLHLIKEYGERPELWDQECEEYKNRFTKHHKWLELAVIFKCSKLEVERKIKILNSQYRRERLKAMKMQKLGKTYRVSWYGYKAFGFLNRNWVRQKNRKILMSDSADIKQEGNTELSDEDLMPFLDDDEPQKECPSYQSEDPVAEKEVEEKEMKFNEKDEWGLFGELVAHAFRRLPDDRTRCIVRHKINTVLYEAELATYDN